MRTQDPVRGEVTAYQDGVWLGRAIVLVDAIAPGEAPPKWNYVVRFISSRGMRVAAGPGVGSPRSSLQAQASPGGMYL